MILLYTLIGLALMMTVLSLGVGVLSMAQGGDFDKAHSEHLMMFRTASQAAAVLLLVIAYILS